MLKDWKKIKGKKTKVRIGPFFEKLHGSNFHGDSDYLIIKFFQNKYYFDVEHYPHFIFYTSGTFKTKSAALKFAKSYMRKN